jgi:predicted esterase YcpF (UPF0227 family)
MHPINEFLSLVQALESYHGRKFTDNFVMPPTDYENLLKEIKGLISSKKIDKKFKKYLSDRTDYWNTKNLRRRLRELYSIHESIFNNFIDNKSYFISKIVDTRNYYTHYDLNLLDNIIDDKSLPMYSQKLKWMILVILLKELDFSDELVKNSFQKYQSYASIRAIY